MQTKEKNNIIFIRLFPDEDLNEQLKKACRDHNVESAVIISGIGHSNPLRFAGLGFGGD